MGLVGKESRAGFFVSEYGLRIINAENTCVSWNIGLHHGTGVYENRLEHIGLAFLLSDRIQHLWEEYQRKLESGELEPWQLLWRCKDEPSQEEVEETKDEQKLEAETLTRRLLRSHLGPKKFIALPYKKYQTRAKETNRLNLKL
jgi:hypothetical protein